MSTLYYDMITCVHNPKKSHVHVNGLNPGLHLLHLLSVDPSRLINLISVGWILIFLFDYDKTYSNFKSFCNIKIIDWWLTLISVIYSRIDLMIFCPYTNGTFCFWWLPIPHNLSVTHGSICNFLVSFSVYLHFRLKTMLNIIPHKTYHPLHGTGSIIICILYVHTRFFLKFMSH